ncbi:FAD-dependent sensor of blue light [Mucilaginibacter yixingensis]|uniref:FAD-dependent sensor of blue light n=1 Tax=Mucilaginibacter yixingensis TaxID=1295612 RepID=A0A2T5JA71_9SPHI|nr:BLUF domain-containing protein [Mucilaginibacter yixingensis]PTQ96947.1 FAD-dependent sensor of blue light [Mucilaginibacter yixingensis]
MDFLIYVSEAATAVTDDGLMAMLEEYRVSNLKLNITGLLLYSQNVFLQVIEGELPDLTQAYAEITKDERFKNIQILTTGETDGRMFKGWRMGFVPVGKQDMTDVKAYLNPIDARKTTNLTRGIYPEIKIIDDFLKEHFS